MSIAQRWSRRSGARVTLALLAAGLVSTSTPAAASHQPRWVPEQGVPWQLQLQGDLDLSVDVPVYEVDGFDTSAETVARMHADGRRVICYISAGSWEEWRPDAGAYPQLVLGASNGWPGERWVDVRRLDVLKPILAARLDMCRDKGFDAVDPDNVDGYTNETGFPLTGAQQLRFNRWLARAAHARGLSIGLKNDLDQAGRLAGLYDFAVNEQCVEYDECESLRPFLRRGKAVFHVEYETDPAEFCPLVPDGFSSIRKEYDLQAWREGCDAASSCGAAQGTPDDPARPDTSDEGGWWVGALTRAAGREPVSRRATRRQTLPTEVV